MNKQTNKQTEELVVARNKIMEEMEREKKKEIERRKKIQNFFKQINRTVKKTIM